MRVGQGWLSSAAATGQGRGEGWPGQGMNPQFVSALLAVVRPVPPSPAGGDEPERSAEGYGSGACQDDYQAGRHAAVIFRGLRGHGAGGGLRSGDGGGGGLRRKGRRQRCRERGQSPACKC